MTWREKRAKLIADARALYAKAESEKRELTAEERTQFDKMLADADRMQETGLAEERRARLEAAEATLNQPEPRLTEPAPPGATPADGQRAAPPATGRGSDDYRRAFRSFLMGGLPVLSAAEHRALQADVNTMGGYLVAPMQMVQALIAAVDNLVFVRQYATKYGVTSADSLGVPSLDADPADPAWTPEIGAVSEDSTMAFGRRELHPHQLTKLVKVSQKLLRTATMDPEALVGQRLAYKFAVTMENAFLNGTGAGQPLGVFTASATGISTSRDVATGNTTTAVTTDGLIEAKYSIKGQYWPRLRWLFNRLVLKTIAKLKDGNGQYIWQPGVQAGQPDRLLNFPVDMSEYAPSTMTAGLYVGILADWSQYWIADATTLSIQRLVELYAANNQVGFIGRLESDGMPVLEEGFARVTLAAL